jgi:hypothetical protein
MPALAAEGRWSLQRDFFRSACSAVPLRTAQVRALAPEGQLSRQILIPIFPASGDHRLHLK